MLTNSNEKDKRVKLKVYFKNTIKTQKINMVMHIISLYAFKSAVDCGQWGCAWRKYLIFLG